MTMTINNRVYTIDTEAGFDVVRAGKVLAHYATYEVAKREASRRKGCYLQYSFVKEGEG